MTDVTSEDQGVNIWKRHLNLQGLDGLKDLPPIAKSHPMTTPAEVVASLCALTLQHPAARTVC